MPRISAPTVAEHRQRQRAALLDAAEVVIVDSGVSGLTFVAVAQRAGLARSSVYEYFPSPAALLAELVVDRMRGWGAATGERLATINDPAERVAEYVRLSLSSAGPEHRSLAQAVSASELPPECAEALVLLHADMVSPLVKALRDLNVADPDRAADHVNGVIEAARRSIQSGADARIETQSAIGFILAAVAAGPR
jgi:AcrR family transcriptional regulator